MNAVLPGQNHEAVKLGYKSLLPAAPLGSQLGTHHPFTNEWSAQGQEATQGLDSVF